MSSIYQQQNIYFDWVLHFNGEYIWILGEEHYNCASALQKSIRGSDENAAVYWMTRMFEGGEDPLFIARRLVVTASEDIGKITHH